MFNPSQCVLSIDQNQHKHTGQYQLLFSVICNDHHACRCLTQCVNDRIVGWLSCDLFSCCKPHTATTTLDGTIAYDLTTLIESQRSISDHPKRPSPQFQALHGERDERDVNSPPITHSSTRRAQYGTFSITWRAD